MLATFTAGGQAFPELLLAALKAGDGQGGDRRGRESAAILVVREGGGYGGATDRWIDLRVDDHTSPIDELMRLLDINHLLMDRPAPEDLLPIDDQRAAELQHLLDGVGCTPATMAGGGGLAEMLQSADMPRSGEPRQPAATWSAAWQAALEEWMGVENLEERMAARGWIDPRVVQHLREKAG